MFIADLTSTCGDYAFISVLVILKDMLSILQLVVPIILIISCIWGLVRMVLNPEDKKGFKSIVNKFIAALIFIFIPALTSLVLTWADDSISISACWATAKEYKAQLDATDDYDVKTTTDERKGVLDDPSDYKFNGTTSNGTTQGKEIVEYALRFIGYKYVYGGGHGFNGSIEDLYASGGAVDCSSFTRLVYQKFGYNLTGTTYTQVNDGVEVPYAQAQAGDLILYDGHVAIFMGDGDKIVHASNSQPYPRGGIKISDNAKYRTILSVRRII